MQVLESLIRQFHSGDGIIAEAFQQVIERAGYDGEDIERVEASMRRRGLL